MAIALVFHNRRAFFEVFCQAMSNDKPLRVYALLGMLGMWNAVATPVVDIALGEILGSTRSDDKKLKLSIDLKLTPLTPVKMANVHH
jgi:hypothetical protein